MFLYLRIPNNGEFTLEFDDKVLHRFTMCKLLYQNGDFSINMSEDFLYVFIESMINCINKKVVVEQHELLGKMGKWQEYFYYDSIYLKSHSNEIELMKKATFISSEFYGTFLYQFKKKLWIELNRGYDEIYNISPSDYYSSPEKYRILLAEISQKTLNEWWENLEKIKEKYQ